MSLHLLPHELIHIPDESLLQHLREAAKRGLGLERIKNLKVAARRSVGVREGTELARMELQLLLSQYEWFQTKLNELVIDVKFLRTSILIVGLHILLGCSNSSEKDAEVGPKFVSEGIPMQGIEGKIGILGPEFVANQANKHMWHLWGSKADLNGKFKVDAINIKSGEKINPFTVDIPTSLGNPNNGADAHVPSLM